jgi:hypothetical protein
MLMGIQPAELFATLKAVLADPVHFGDLVKKPAPDPDPTKGYKILLTYMFYVVMTKISKFFFMVC